MAGAIKKIIEEIVDAKAGGDPAVRSFTRAKIIMKGVNPSKFTETSEDDPLIINKLKQIALEFGLSTLQIG